MVAEIVINCYAKQLNRIFDYQIPKAMEDTLQIGDRVLVPFGRSKQFEEGFVVGIKTSSEYQIKEIAEIQTGFTISKEKIELAKWMASQYFCNVSDAIKLMLPPGTTSKQVEHRISEKNVMVVYLTKEANEIEKRIEEGKVKSDKHIRVLRFLYENEGVLTSDLENFCDVSRSVLQTLEKNGYLEMIKQHVERNPFAHKVAKQDQSLRLTTEQTKAYDAIAEAMDQNRFDEYLIYGITGSRKNGNLFAIDSKSTREKSICYYARSRNFINTTNGKSFYGTLWTRNHCYFAQQVITRRTL